MTCRRNCLSLGDKDLVEHFAELNVNEFWEIVFKKIEQGFVNMLPGHGDLDGGLRRVHLL